jgi:hypothetical protein
MSYPINQASFIGGELAPSLHGRIDLQRYGQAAKRIENFIVEPHGGVCNRPGSEFFAQTKMQDGKYVRLITFSPSVNEQYVLEFGHLYLRVYDQNGPVLTTPYPWHVTNATGIEGGVLVSQVRTKGLAQSFTVPSGGFNLGAIDLRIGATGTIGTVNVTLYDDNAGVPGNALSTVFTGPSAADIPAGPSPAFSRWYADAPLLVNEGTVLHIQVDCEPSSGLVTLHHTLGNKYSGGTLKTWNGSSWVTVSAGAADAIFRVVGPGSIPVEIATPYTSHDQDDIGTESVVSRLVTAQSVDVMTIADGTRQNIVHELRRLSPSSWELKTLENFVNYGFPVPRISPSGDAIQRFGSDPGGTPTRDWQYAVSGVTADGKESLPVYSGVLAVGSNISSVRPLRLAVTAGDPVDHFNVYKGLDSTFGYIGTIKPSAQAARTWQEVYDETYAISFQAALDAGYGEMIASSSAQTDATLAANIAAANTDTGWTSGVTVFYFNDDNIAPDYTDHPREAVNPFVPDPITGLALKPGCVAFFQQRRVFANVEGQPDTLWMSETGDYLNYQRSIPTVDDDAIMVTLAQGGLNEIRSMIPLRSLMVFTAGGEFVMSGEKGAVTPSNLDAAPVSYRGSGTLQPLVIGGVVLFKDRGGHIREWVYEQQSNDFPSTDVGILASHLFNYHRIVDWVYASSPRSVVWLVRDDGVMLSFTYAREQSVAAWARHTTSGKYRSVCSLRTGAAEGETLYVVVDRTISGTPMSFIERVLPRDPSSSPFLDSSLTSSLVTGGGFVLTLKQYPLTKIVGDRVIVGHVIAGTLGYKKGNWCHAQTDSVQLSTDLIVNGTKFYVFKSPLGERFVGKLVLADDPTGIGTASGFWIELQQDLLPSLFDGKSPDPVPIDAPDWNLASTRWGWWNHLVGQVVSVCADGGVTHRSVTVESDGTITIDFPASQVTVGLPYESTLQTLALTDDGRGSIRSKQKLVNEIQIEVADTRGVWVGEDENDLTEVKPEFPENTALSTGRLTVRASNRWNDNGSIFIKQVDPLPCTILAVTPEVVVGG